MRNILISLFILSCLSVNIAYAYEKENAQTQGASISPAGVEAGVKEGANLDNNKTLEAVKQAETLKEQQIDYDNNSDEDKAGEEANKPKTEQALDKVEQKLIDTEKETQQVEVLEQVDEDLMDADKEVIEEDEKMKEDGTTQEK